MQLPALGATVRLYPAPRADVDHEPGKPPLLRRVQDGAGHFGRFLPDEGADRVFTLFFHDRLLAGDVCLTDPRAAFAPAAVGALQRAPGDAAAAPGLHTPPAPAATPPAQHGAPAAPSKE